MLREKDRVVGQWKGMRYATLLSGPVKPVVRDKEPRPRAVNSALCEPIGASSCLAKIIAGAAAAVVRRSQRVEEVGSR